MDRKPRICDVLGIDVGERFCFTNDIRNAECSYEIQPDGNIKGYSSVGSWDYSRDILLQMINNPDCIAKMPKFTKQEIQDAKSLLRMMHPSWDGVRRNPGGLFLTTVTNGVLPLNYDLFPSIAVGESFQLSEIVGDNS